MDDETKQAIADAEQRAKDFASGLSAKYVKADSMLHVFIREHSQAAFNCALVFGLVIAGGLGYIAGLFAK